MWRTFFTVALFTGFCVQALEVRAEQAAVNPHMREGCILCHHENQEGGTLIFTPDSEGPHEVIAHSCKTCHKEGKKNFWILVLPTDRPHVPGTLPSSRPPAAEAPPPAEGEAGFANSHDSEECTKCHEEDPGTVQGRLPGPFPYGDLGISAFCRNCHSTVDASHYPRANRPRTTVNCLNCHQVHGNTLLFPSLREDYPVFLIENRDINPHGGKIFCLSCHKDSPQGSQVVNFRSEGDSSGMCQRCHTEVEHHPLNVKSSPGTWKMDFSDFPIEEEKVTCVTCHDPPECESIVSRDNPRFLRGGPYNAVEDFCTRCHEGRSFVNLNPHDQIDDSGNIRHKQCLYCHTAEPEEGYTLGSEDFTDTLQALCASCHPTPPHPNVDHMVEIPNDMLKDLRQYEERRLVKLPLDDGDRLTCVTCHNPHERGLLKGPAGVGADEETRLRLATFNEICSPCHGRH